MARLRLATFNIENLDYARAHEGTFERRAGVLRPILEMLDPDILCLQEIGAQKPHKHSPREYLALDRLLKETRLAAFHRAATLRPGGDAPADVHNLVILSRWPIVSQRQLFHDLVAPWSWTPPREDGITPSAMEIRWDRPALYAATETPDGRPLHIVNLHLRAPRAAPVATARGLGSSRALVEGQFISAMKREGQALEARLFVETLFDETDNARIAICGDFNADEHDAPTRLLRGGRDAGEDAPRALIALEARVEPDRRHTVIHAGRPAVIDHILASQALTATWRETTILNDGLQDEVHAQEPIDGALHAPVVAAFDL